MTFWYTFWTVFITLEIITLVSVALLTKEKILSYFPDHTSPESKFLSSITEMLHVVAAVPLDLGFLLPKKYLPYHIIATLLLLLHWETNDGECILTEIQNKLDGTQGFNFTPQVLNDIFNINLKPSLDIGRYTKYIALTISFIRLAASSK